jgi:hypothetical protein
MDFDSRGHCGALVSKLITCRLCLGHPSVQLVAAGFLVVDFVFPEGDRAKMGGEGVLLYDSGVTVEQSQFGEFEDVC